MTKASPTPGVPAELTALFALARREVSGGRMAEAGEVFRQILSRWPTCAEAHNYLANVLLLEGRHDEAAGHYEHALALRPELVEPYNNLGTILRGQGRLREAVLRFEQALVLRPDFAEAHNNLGNALKELGQLDEAATHYRRALALRPELAEAHNNLGTVLEEQGQPEQAVIEYQQAIALKPNYAEAYKNLGKSLKEQGCFAESRQQYAQALALRPDFAEAHYDLADLKTFTADDRQLAALESLAAEGGRLPPSKQLYVHFALGKALEDVGDYPRAFEQWRLGNALKRREVLYDEEAYHEYLRQIATTFNAALLTRRAGAGDPSPVPIFIVGMPRSGSTLVEQILASHPQVKAAGELWSLDRLVQSAADPATGKAIAFPECLTALDANGLRRMGAAYLKTLPATAEGQTRVTDKMPKNFVYLGLIRLILPQARIIHTTRDPLDTCLSCFARLFTTGLTYSYDLGELGRYYRGYQELMAHWKRVLPAEAMLDVAYEEVVDDLPGQARRLIEYCGLPWDDRCLKFHETSRLITTPSNVQARRPLYRSSLARWRRYEAFLEPLFAALTQGDSSNSTSAR